MFGLIYYYYAGGFHDIVVGFLEHQQWLLQVRDENKQQK